MRAADLKLKTDVKTLKAKETVKREAVEAVLYDMQKKDRIAMRQADEKRL